VTSRGAASLRSRWRLVVLCTLGMMVLQVGWILAVPPYFGIDEIDHAYRASSVAAGHWLPEDLPSDQQLARGELVAVPRDIPAATHDACVLFPYMAPEDCTPVGAAPAPGEVLIASTASRYNPLFYAATQVVAVHADGFANLYLMRATAALLCALVFAAGVWSTLVWSRSRWPLAMFLLAMTPEMLYSSTIASPNGLEMVSGLTFTSALFGLFVGSTAPTRNERRGLLAVAVVSGAALVTVHTLGPLWLALTSLLVLVIAGLRPVLRRVREAPRGYLAAGALLGLSVAASAAWVVATGTNQASPTGARVPGSAWPEVLLGIVYWPIQAIATFPSRDEPAPLYVYPIVLAVVAAAVYRAVPGLRGRLGAAAVFLVGVSFAVPLALTALTYHQYGLAWQGRYGMPFSVGFFLVLGLAIDRHAPGSRLRRRTIAGAGLVTALVLVVCEQHLVQRQLTLALWRDNPHWHVPHLLVLVALVGAGLGLWALGLLGIAERTDRVDRAASPHLLESQRV
jgi:hypothetical protein